MTRDRKTGKFIRVGPALATKSNEQTIEVWEKDPSIAAFTDLMNRALDKPQEPKQELQVSGDWDRLTARLASARQRVARR